MFFRNCYIKNILQSKVFLLKKKERKVFWVLEILGNKYRKLFLFCLLWGTDLSNLSFFRLCKIKTSFSILSLYGGKIKERNKKKSGEEEKVEE